MFLSQQTDINKINWKKFDVDYVFECTGKFNSKDKLLPHLKNGAKKLLYQLHVKMRTKQLYLELMKVIKKDDNIISAASCTTNCLAPYADVLNENLKLKKVYDYYSLFHK